MKSMSAQYAVMYDDPEVGDPDSGIAPAQPLKTSPTDGYVPSVASAKTCSNKNHGV